MASYRHLLRTCVVQALLSLEFKSAEPEIVLAEVLKDFAPKVDNVEYAVKTLTGVLKNQPEILELIQKFAPEWPVEKIARLDRAVLEVGVFELIFNDEVPPLVAINEAIEIAKHFGDSNSSRFINGVLSSIMKHHEKFGKTTGAKI